MCRRYSGGLRCAWVCCGVLAAVAGSAEGAQILGVDFGLAGTPNSPVQAGFSEFAVGGNTASPSKTFTGLSGITSGSVTIQLMGSGVFGRDRGAITGSGSYSYSDLERDLVGGYTRGTTADNVSVLISGLDPATQYQFQIWSVDKNFNNGATYTWYDVTAPGVVTQIGQITNQTSPAPSNNDQFSIVATVTSDASGAVKLEMNDSAGTGALNGLTISTAVPEPGCAGLVGAALVAGLARRAGRRSSRESFTAGRG